MSLYGSIALLLAFLQVALAQSPDELAHLSPATIKALQDYESEKVSSTAFGLYPIYTFVLWAAVYASAHGSEWAANRWSTEFHRMSLTTKRTTIMYMLGIFWTALGFALQMLCWGMWSAHYTPFNIHCLEACATVVSTLYLFELSYRSEMRLPMLAHHFSTLGAMMFTVAAVEKSLDPSIYLTALVWLFQATTEQLLFLALFMYRLKFSPRIVPQLLRVGALQALCVKIASVCWILWWWARRQEHHKSAMEIAFSVVLVLSMVCLTVIPVQGTYVVFILAGSYERKFFEATTTSPSATPAPVESAEKLDQESFEEELSQRIGQRNFGSGFMLYAMGAENAV